MQSNIQIQILKKMIYHGYIGGRHTSVDNICKGFPPHVKKEVRKEIRRLYNNCFLLTKPTNYGKQLSINPRKIKEIKHILISEILED